MKNKLLQLLLLFPLLLASCFEEEKPYPAYEGTLTTIKNHIEYNQSFYDFEANTVVASFPSDAWSIGFSCGVHQFVVITNSGDHWFAFNSKQSDLWAEIIFPSNKRWDFDQQSYFPDSTAIDNWMSIRQTDTVFSGNVYLVGKYSGGAYSAIFRMKILEADSLHYTFCYASFTGNFQADTVTMPKLFNKNFVYYSFTDSVMLDPEPDKSSYDIVFGPFYDIATEMGITQPYLVRGALLNFYNVKACADSLHSYTSISADDLNAFKFTSRRNTIGFGWKEVAINPSSGTVSYIIRPEMNYLVNTVEGNYYKMRFLSYELNGETGYPSFELEELQTP
jgi:hypothetical protein